MIFALLISPAPFGTINTRAADDKAPSGMKKAAENDSLILYVDEEETDIAVLVKSSGDLWYSNPTDSKNDEMASPYQKRQLKSQIFLRYFNENVQESSMDNYSDSIAEGQFEIEYTDNGLKITYMLGEGAVKILLPTVISVERLESFASRLDSSKSKKLLRNYTKLDPATMKEADKKEKLESYPGLAVHSIYVLKTSTKDYIKEELSGYLQDVGYTWDDYTFDLEDNGYETTNTKPWFSIPLTYRLEGESLIAEVDPTQIEYNDEGYYLVDVELLPYFGAAKKGENGYLFIPDGSGALIRFDNNASTAYSAKLYGQDVTMNVLSTTKSQVDQSVTVKLPVFGAKLGDTAWYAIIEDGDGYADITASVSGRINSYNNVYAGFQFLEYGVSTLGNVVGSNSFQMYSAPSFSGTYKLRYSFLSGEKANYPGMAEGYRDYLIEKGILKNRLAEGHIPFYAEYIGAIDKSASFLGIKYRAVTPVTTYAQAEKITDMLIAGGVSNINTVYSGWANDGLHGTAYTKVKSIGKLSKGGVDQEEFISHMAAKGVDTFFTAEFQRVYYDVLGDGYSLLGSAPKYFDRSSVKEATYYLSNGTVDANDKICLIRPSLAQKVTEQLKKKFSKYGNIGFNAGSISYNLYTDQQSENYTDRQMAKNYNTSAVKDLGDAFGGRILLDNANSYMFGYASDVINAPLDSNRNLIVDDVVPFYEMVLHGYVDFAGDCLNMTDDYRTTLLKSIESGSGLYFKWIYSENSTLKETDFDYLYSVNYEGWMTRAIDDYRRADQALGSLRGQTITGHEIITDKVVRVTYEKGTQILVNYSKAKVYVDGVAVEAGSFAVVNRNEK